MFTKGDFHIHSTSSDGEFTPREIVLFAKNRGIDTIAISDHNSVSAVDEASKAGMQYGVSVIPAIELSTRFNGESIHLLGYFRDRRYSSSTFQQILRLVRTHKVVEARKIFGGYRRKQAQSRYLSVSEGMYLLKSFGAAVVLAHPVRISANSLPKLLSMPFDGIEAKYCHIGDYYTSLFIKIALDRFNFYTGGSDFHTNKIKDSNHCLIGDPYLNSLEIHRFLNNSGALVLGAHNAENENLNRYTSYY